MKDGLNVEQQFILQQVESALPQVLKLPEPARSQSLTCLAYEYFLQDMEEKAFTLLEKADPNYFKEPMKKDMESDPRMNKIIMTILAKIIEIGYVEVKTKNDQEG